MELQKQCVSLEIAKQLKSLGVKQESLFVYVEHFYDMAKSLPSRPPTKWDLYYKDQWETDGLEPESIVSAFTTAELGELLPEGFTSSKRKGGAGYECYLFNEPNQYPVIKAHEFADTEADARGLLLIYLLEQGLLTQTK